MPISGSAKRSVSWRPGFVTIVTVSVGILMILAAAPPAEGSWSVFAPAPPLLLVATPANVRAGDVESVSVDVYVSDDGLPTDPDETPNVTYRALGDDVPLEEFRRIGVGHFRGEVAIPDDNANSLGDAGTIDTLVTAQANISGVPYVRYLVIPWYRPGTYIRVSLNNNTPSMGDAVVLTAEVFNRSTPVDPDDIRFTLTVPSTYDEEVKIPERIGTGVYRATFVIPAADSPYVVRIFNAIAHLGDEEIQAAVAVHVPQYQVWFHTESLEGGRARGAFWVADEWGRPAGSVPIHADGTLAGALDGFTDSQGRYAVDAPLSSGTTAWMSGYVGRPGPMENSFTVYVHAPTGPPPEPVVPLDPPLMANGRPRDFLFPGEQVTRRIQLWTGRPGAATPLTNAPVGVAVWTARSLIEAGRQETDASGVLSVTFTVPLEDVFVGVTHEGAVVDVLSYRVASPNVGFESSPLTLGGPTHVRGIISSDRQELLDARPYLYSQSEVLLLDPPPGESWQIVSQILGDDLYPAGPARVHDYHLPTFLPSDGSYLVSIRMNTGTESLTQFAVLRPGEGAEIPIGSGRGDDGSAGPEGGLWILAGIVVVLAAVAVSVTFALMRRRKPPPAP